MAANELGTYISAAGRRLTYIRLALALALVLALGSNHPDGDHRYSRLCEECGSDAVVCPWCWCCGGCCGCS
jgi:hypothetical protein